MSLLQTSERKVLEKSEFMWFGKVLIIQFKWFWSIGKLAGKLTDDVTFSVKLDVSKYHKGEDTLPAVNHLFVVANQHGETLSSGHYTAPCLQWNNQDHCFNDWVHFNDKKVQQTVSFSNNNCN